MSAGAPQNNLLKLLDFSQCECRNEATPNTFLSLLQNQGSAKDQNSCLESGNEDPQLFISVGFSVPVRLTGLRLRAPKGSVASGEAPRRLRLFFNDPTKSFSDAETDPATDEFDLPEDESIEDGRLLPLKSVRYNGVASLQIFIEDNRGAPTTKIAQVDFFGTPVDSLQMKDWKPLKPEEALAQNDT